MKVVMPKPVARVPPSFSIPQPIARGTSPITMGQGLFLPALELANVKNPSVRIANQSNLPNSNCSTLKRPGVNDKVKKRLARKAELARASRRRKKAYVQDLEDKVSRLTQQLSTFERERVLLGLAPKDKLEDSSTETQDSDKDSGADQSTTVDGLSGLATAAASLATSFSERSECTTDSGGESSSGLSSSVKTEDEDRMETTDRPRNVSQCLSPQVPLSPMSMASSNRLAAMSSPGFAFDPSMPFILGLAPSLTTKFSTVGAPFAASTSSAFADMRDHKFLSSISLPPTSMYPNSTSVTSEKDEGEKCIKATYKNDTRRFSLPSSHFTFPVLVQTLRGIYQNLPAQFVLKYYDEEKDSINITTTTELQEAYRLLPRSPPSKPSSSPQPSSQLLKIFVEDSTQTTATTSTTTEESPIRPVIKKTSKRKNLSQKASSSETNKRKTTQSSSSSSSSSSQKFPICLQKENGCKICVMVESSTLVSSLKTILTQFAPITGLDPESYTFSYEGKILDPTQSLSTYNIKKHAILLMDAVISFPSQSSPITPEQTDWMMQSQKLGEQHAESPPLSGQQCG